MNTQPTYRTAPAFRSSQPISWSARFAQNRPDGGGGGGQVAWQQRFSHSSGNGYWQHHDGGSSRNWNNNPNNLDAADDSSGGNLTAPIAAAVATIAWDAFGPHSDDAGSNNTTIINNYNSDNNATPPLPDNEPVAEVPEAPVVVVPAPEIQVAIAPLNNVHLSHTADSDLPVYDNGPVVVHEGNAPADEYFGSSHMSVLGIRNSINDTNTKAPGAGEEQGHNLLHKLLFTEQAFHDWQSKYPHDTWIIVNGYEMVDDFAKLDAETPDENPHVASIHGLSLGDWLDKAYPGNQYTS